MLLYFLFFTGVLLSFYSWHSSRFFSLIYGAIAFAISFHLKANWDQAALGVLIAFLFFLFWKNSKKMGKFLLFGAFLVIASILHMHSLLLKMSEDKPILKVVMTGQTEPKTIEWKTPSGMLQKKSLTCYEVQLYNTQDQLLKTYFLYGDLCGIRAKIIRFSPLLNWLGLDNLYQIDAVYNGYRDPLSYNTFPVEAYSFSSSDLSILWKTWNSLFSDPLNWNWIIPETLRNVDLDPRENSRSSTIVNGSVLTIQTRLRSLNPGVLARSKFHISNRFWYKSATLETSYFPLTDTSCKPFQGQFFLTLSSGGVSSSPL